MAGTSRTASEGKDSRTDPRNAQRKTERSELRLPHASRWTIRRSHAEIVRSFVPQIGVQIRKTHIDCRLVPQTRARAIGIVPGFSIHNRRNLIIAVLSACRSYVGLGPNTKGRLVNLQ